MEYLFCNIWQGREAQVSKRNPLSPRGLSGLRKNTPHRIHIFFLLKWPVYILNRDSWFHQMEHLHSVSIQKDWLASITRQGREACLRGGSSTRFRTLYSYSKSANTNLIAQVNWMHQFNSFCGIWCNLSISWRPRGGLNVNDLLLYNKFVLVFQIPFAF
jgi:hypothetical protein